MAKIAVKVVAGLVLLDAVARRGAYPMAESQLLSLVKGWFVRVTALDTSLTVFAESLEMEIIAKFAGFLEAGFERGVVDRVDFGKGLVDTIAIDIIQDIFPGGLCGGLDVNVLGVWDATHAGPGFRSSVSVGGTIRFCLG